MAQDAQVIPSTANVALLWACVGAADSFVSAAEVRVVSIVITFFLV
jgi:hypothetical protein